jgi:hypothetical protein
MVKFPGMAANTQYARTHSVPRCSLHPTQAGTQPTPPSEDVNRPTVTGPPISPPPCGLLLSGQEASSLSIYSFSPRCGSHEERVTFFFLLIPFIVNFQVIPEQEERPSFLIRRVGSFPPLSFRPPTHGGHQPFSFKFSMCDPVPTPFPKADSLSARQAAGSLGSPWVRSRKDDGR